MKRLSLFIVALSFLSLCGSVFADKVTNKTTGSTGDTINTAYGTTVEQTLELYDDVTETGSTNPVVTSTVPYTSTITLQSNDDSTVRTITSATGSSGVIPIFDVTTTDSTINLILNNVGIAGCLVGDGNEHSSHPYKISVTLSGNGTPLTLTGIKDAEGKSVKYERRGGVISGYYGVTINNFSGLMVSGYDAWSCGGALHSDDNDISISNITGDVSFTNNEVHQDTYGQSKPMGGAIAGRTIYKQFG